MNLEERSAAFLAYLIDNLETYKARARTRAELEAIILKVAALAGRRAALADIEAEKKDRS